MILEVDSLTHTYGDELAVSEVSFGLKAGEMVGLLGPSGCGKTTIVQAIAGHLTPTSGEVSLRGERVTQTPPESRQIGVVFQEPTLFPHLTVRENVAYGLEATTGNPDSTDSIVESYCSLVELDEQLDSYPRELSGGQRRRVELARALAPEPDVLVLDEPLSGLDRSLRQQLRGEIARIQEETGVTTLFVTHDQEEAMALADRLVVMNDGEIAGVGDPRTLYESPPSQFVAGFLGRSNTINATQSDDGSLLIAGTDISLDVEITNPPTDTVTCHLRPDAIDVVLPGTNADCPSLDGTVTHVADVGRRYDLTVELGTGEEVVVECSENQLKPGDRCSILVPTDAVCVFEGTPQRD